MNTHLQVVQTPVTTVPKIQALNFKMKTDAELVILCQKHYSGAFEQLVKKHQRTVYGILYNLAPEWLDTADLVQETFIRVWRGVDSLQNPYAFRSWLTQIVTNLFYDELRKRSGRLPTVSMDECLNAESESEKTTRDIRDDKAGPDEMYQRKELGSAVRKAISALPENFRTAIVLREMEGLSYAEIALMTGSDVGTVKSRISRARVKVQNLLKSYIRADREYKVAC